MLQEPPTMGASSCINVPPSCSRSIRLLLSATRGILRIDRRIHSSRRSHNPGNRCATHRWRECVHSRNMRGNYRCRWEGHSWLWPRSRQPGPPCGAGYFPELGWHWISLFVSPPIVKSLLDLDVLSRDFQQEGVPDIGGGRSLYVILKNADKGNFILPPENEIHYFSGSGRWAFLLRLVWRG